jgi:hypothetical protein
MLSPGSQRKWNLDTFHNMIDFRHKMLAIFNTSVIIEATCVECAGLDSNDFSDG